MHDCSYYLQNRIYILQWLFYYSILIFMKNKIRHSCSTFNTENFALFMLEYNFQPVVTSFVSIALIMMVSMMTIVGINRTVLPILIVTKM